MADLSKIKLNGVEYDLKDAVARAAINNGLKLQVVEELPSENIDENTLYLVPAEPNVIREATTTGVSTTTQVSILNINFINGNIYDVNISAKAVSQETDIDVISYQDSFTWNGETITLLEENNWVITAESDRIKGVYSSASKDSLEMNVLVKEIRIENQYDCYISINEQWEKVNDSNQFMVKGIDYVTAGQKENTSLGIYATAEGKNTTASGTRAHAEGRETTASGANSHAEGYSAVASGGQSHAEGRSTAANGAQSHAEGISSKAQSTAAHAEGWITTATGSGSHTEGYSTQADGDGAHAEGYGFFNNVIKITGLANVTTYNFTYTDNGAQVIQIGQTVEAKINNNTITTTVTAIDKTNHTITFAQTFDANNAISAQNVTIQGHAIGYSAHTEGFATTVNKEGGHAEGGVTVVDARWAHAEGYATRATGGASHSEGQFSTASGLNSHAEGYNAIASGNTSHAEGGTTTASGMAAHAEGGATKASGQYSHSEGYYANAKGFASHAEGQFTIAAKQSQHVFGEANIEDVNTTTQSRGSYVEIVGNGTIDTNGNTAVVTTRSNARTLDWSGNEWLAGKLTVSVAPVNDMDVATKQYVDTAMSNVNMPGVVLDEEVIAMMAELGYAVPVTDENNEPLTNNGSQILG